MYTTSATLLERLRQPGQGEAWERFARLYTPLLHTWARRQGLEETEAADLVQEVFVLLLRKLPEFRYDENQSFRGWLRTVTLNKWRELRRRRVPATRAGDDWLLEERSARDETNLFEEEEFRQYLVERALQLLQKEFRPTTWQAFWETSVQGRPAAEVARELGLTPGAVRGARFRVACRLRAELGGMLEGKKEEGN